MNSQIKPAADQPDPDAIKMFVGQVPRTMDEDELKAMFEEYGPVFQLNILRDKVTGQSKGCCFITFFTRKAALDAQNALHNIKTMAGMHHPVQMKPADSEKRSIEERKLFVGMITKKYDENEVRMMFAPFGMIEDCTVLRDQNGQSRGCAFITYATRQCAQNAIKSMHHSQTMEGCSSPLVVKFADTQKEKEAKKLQQMNSNLWNMSIGGLGPLGPQYLSLLQNAAQTGNMNLFQNLGLTNVGIQQLLQATAASANTNPGDNNMHNLQNLQSLAALANATGNQSQGSMNQYNMQNLSTLNQLAAVANNSSNASGILGSSNDMSQSLQSTAQSLSQILASQAAASQASDHQSYMSLLGRTVRPLVSGSMSGTNTTNSLGSLQGLHSLSGNNVSNLSSLAQGMSSSMNGIGSSGMSNSQTNMDALSQAYSGIQQYAASFPNAFNGQTSNQLQASASTPAGRQSEGPDGANLFIYHLPQEFHDQDLMQTFVPFGNVVSSKVFIDKQTNLSKCFGFVSYDNPLSATAAIQAMNGFQIGMKRLKVQLKRPKSESKPY